MQRVALIAPQAALRKVLVEVAAAGAVQLDHDADDRASVGPAARLLQQQRSGPVSPILVVPTPDLEELVRAGRVDLLAGEAELEQYANDAVRHGEVAALLGWCPAPQVPELAARLSGLGAAVVPLPAPRGVDPPTLLPAGGLVRRSFAPLIRTYGTVPYPDVDPTLLAGIAYVVMFGMMFGDAGQGLLLLAAAGLVGSGRLRRFPRLRPAWPFIAGAGLASTIFGVLYGEFFGPSGLLPVLWLAPLEAPLRLLGAALGIGAVLMAAAYLVAIINRWREGGPRLAVYASAGIAGAAVFLGVGALATGLYLRHGMLTALGTIIVVVGVVLAGIGFFAATGGGPSGALQAVVEVFDALLRLGSNVVSFARLAAFGLTHAALGWLVWRGTVALAGHGWWGVLAAAVVFVAGTLVAFALEALVAAVQALRLEFYELFSRIFAGQGQPFRPWHIPTAAPIRFILEVSP
jgi:V/A-type H+-transporting ATPase subunit I